MDREYIKPSLKIFNFSFENIITTSGCTGDCRTDNGVPKLEDGIEPGNGGIESTEDSMGEVL